MSDYACPGGIEANPITNLDALTARGIFAKGVDACMGDQLGNNFFGSLRFIRLHRRKPIFNLTGIGFVLGGYGS